MSNPRILHLAKWYPHDEDEQNGVFIQNQIRACRSFANHAVLYWGAGSDSYWQYENEDSIPTLRMYFLGGNRLKNVNRKWGSIRRIIEEAWQGESPDLIHLHIADNDQYILLEYAKKHGIPVILSEHWSGYLDGRYEQKGGLANQLIQSLFKRVDEVTTVSGFLADAIIEKTGRKDIRIVPNVLETQGLDTEDPSEANYSFGMLCDLDDRVKNVSGAIRAFRAFHENHPDATLSIIGGGTDHKKLKDLTKELNLEDSVVFKGRYNHKESLEFLKEVETVIINSRRETFSVVALEAIALGKKLICTRCGGPETFLMDNLVLWTRIDDDIDLLAKMEESIDREKPSIEEIILQVEPFLPEVVSAQWQSIYKGLLLKAGR